VNVFQPKLRREKFDDDDDDDDNNNNNNTLTPSAQLIIDEITCQPPVQWVAGLYRGWG